ncbi:N-acetylglucosamine-6-phosphate deacetylase [Gordonibacter pamelaeae]|uniref:N-acetylglucosamine-6-phosphate deacetylase n=1 Tax=Gordonibacter pamelaeae TaxID=471189 RepID=UPI00242D5F62|nr:N-acetylglucosamine-6-phosphate deacetylase [Gordonibacter pamelaeae]
MRIINGSVFDGEGFVERDVYAADGRFVEEAARAEDGETVDASGCYVIPGLVDLHFHGSAGADISDGDLTGLHKMGAYEASRGITALCPATMTLPEDVLMRAAQAASAYEPAADEAALVGINMEGPFISPSKVGAQNPDYVRNPSAEEFRRLQEAAGGLFKLVDIAPEEPGAEEFIREMADEVRISLAHTCTDYDTAVRAFELGARQLTHLYNAMDPMHHRKPGPIPAAVEHGEVTAEIIADGVHIHPAMVRLAFQLFGDDRMILISDTLRAAGLEDGTYDLGGQDVTVRGPVATIDNGALAGSVSDLMRCLTVAVRDMGIPLASAVKAASANPARALGLDAERGAIEPGKVADAVLLDKETLDLRAVVLRGELLA